MFVMESADGGSAARASDFVALVHRQDAFTAELVDKFVTSNVRYCLVDPDPTRLADVSMAKASYVKVNIKKITVKRLGALRTYLTKLMPNALIIIDGVETTEERDACFANEVHAVQGTWMTDERRVVHSTSIESSVRPLMQMIASLQGDFDVNVLGRIVKSDVSLGVKLLKFANSVGIGQGNVVSSYTHAMQMIGSEKLYRWASMQLIGMSGDRRTALVKLAVTRGHVAEALATRIGMGDDDVSRAFIAASFSLLPFILDVNIHSLSRELHLHPDITQAMLGGNSKITPLVNIARAMEGNSFNEMMVFGESNGVEPTTLNQINLRSLLMTENAIAEFDVQRDRLDPEFQ